MKSELIKGIIIGVVLTFIGAVIQTYLMQDYENKKYIRQWDIMVIKQLDDRLTKSTSILANSGNEFFKERWSNYIYETIYPWNQNLSTLESHIKKYHNNLYDKLISIEKKFKKIHNNLNTLRKLQNKGKEKRIVIEKKVSEQLEDVRKNILEVKGVLLY